MKDECRQYPRINEHQTSWILTEIVKNDRISHGRSWSCTRVITWRDWYSVADWKNRYADREFTRFNESTDTRIPSDDECNSSIAIRRVIHFEKELRNLQRCPSTSWSQSERSCVVNQSNWRRHIWRISSEGDTIRKMTQSTIDREYFLILYWRETIIIRSEEKSEFQRRKHRVALGRWVHCDLNHERVRK